MRRNIELLNQLIEQDAPSEHELQFMRAMFLRPRMTIADAYQIVFPAAARSTAQVNGSRMLARIMRKGWIQYAFEEAGLTAGYAISKLQEALNACDVIPVSRRDGRVDYIETPNWKARAWALQMLSKMHGMLQVSDLDPNKHGKETFAECVRTQTLLLQGEGGGNGKVDVASTDSSDADSAGHQPEQ